MKRKQFLALMLSASMLATSSVPAYAADVEAAGDASAAYTAEAPTEEPASESSENLGSVPTYNNVETPDSTTPQTSATDEQTPSGETIPGDEGTTSTEDVETVPETDTTVTPDANTPNTDAPEFPDEDVTTTPSDAPADAPSKAPAASDKTEGDSDIQTTDVDDTEWPLTGDELQNGADFMVGAENFVGHYKIVDDTTVDMVYTSLRYTNPEWPEEGTMDVTNVIIPATIEKDGKTYNVRKVSFNCDVTIAWDTNTLTFEEGITDVYNLDSRGLKTLVLPSTLTSFNKMTSKLEDGTPAYRLGNYETYEVVFPGNDTLKFDAEQRLFYLTERGSGSVENIGDQFTLQNFKYEVVEDGVVDIIDIFENDGDNNVNVVVPSQLTFKGKEFKVRNVILDEYTGFDNCKQMRSLTFEEGIEKIKFSSHLSDLTPENYNQVETINIPASMNVENPLRLPQLNTITVDPTNPYVSSEDGILYNKEKTVLLCYPAAKTADSYTVPASVKTIKSGAFTFVKGLQNLNVPSTVETLEESAIAYSLGIKNITVDGVQNVGNFNLDYCRGTETMTVKHINGYPQGFLYDNSDLKTINIVGDVEYIGILALTKNTALEAYNVSDASIISSKDGVLYNFGTIWSYPAGKTDETFVIPEDTHKIGANAFNGTQHLKKLICPKGISFSAASVYEPAVPVDVYLADQDTIHLETLNSNIFISSVGGHVYAPTQAALDSILNHENQNILNGMTAKVGFIPIESASVSVDSITVNKGNTEKLEYEVYPTYATEPLQFEVSNDICSVSPDGVVTGLKSGTGTITVKSSTGTLKTIDVTVKNPLQSMKFESDTFEMDKGDAKELKLVYEPEDADVTDIKWESSNKRVVTIDKFGYAIGIGAGTATVTATCQGITATCTVTVKVPLESISMSETEKVVNKGESFDLDITMNPTDATVSEDVVWTTKDENIATVDANGKVTAVSAGTTTITASLEGKETTCEVTVKVPMESIELSETEVSLVKGETKKLNVTHHPSDTTDDKALTWESDNTDVVTVDKNGEITAEGAGAATITVSCGKFKATCKVTVSVPLEGISMSESEKTVNKGESFDLDITMNPTDATVSENVNWVSDKETVATVDANGKVTAVGAGEATITATLDGKTTTCKITVKIPLESIELSEEKVSLVEGTTKQLTVKYNPTDTTVDKAATWSSSDNSIASVDADGNITAKTPGTVTITAEVDGKKDSCEVTVTKKEIALDSIELSKDSLSLVEGEGKQLLVKYNPTNTTVDKTVTWSSSEKNVATVDKNGNITAVKEGTAIITATVAGKTDTCTVTVSKKQIALDSIELSEEKVSLVEGEGKQLTVKYNPTNTTVDKTVTWSSSDKNVVTVDKNGNITAVKEGTAIITATVAGKTDTCSVTVTKKDTGDVEVALESIELSKEKVSLVEGEASQLTVKYNPTNTTVDKTVAWSSSNDSVATVDKNGNITAVKEGTAIITATVAGKTDTCTVTVTKKDTGDVEVALKSIALSKDSISLTEGESDRLSVSYNPSNTTVDKTVAWSSSDKNVATVDKNGNITAVKAGTATITATVAGKTATCKVTVTKKDVNTDVALNFIELSELNMTLEKNSSSQLTVKYNPENTTVDKTVTWSSDNEKVAAVDKNGKVTAKGVGKATIFAEVSGKKAKCVVTVVSDETTEQPESMKLPYTDVNAGDWFYDEVAEMYYSGTMTGIDSDTFAPYDSVARAQFAVIIYRLLNSPEVEFTQQYPDVGDDIWYTDAITYASNMGIITGYTDSGKFGPADNINREQLAVMLYRLCKATGRDTSARGDLGQFVDGGRVNDFAREAMEWAVGTGIISGKDGGTKCDPQGRASRAECAIMMSRFFRL